MLGIGQLFKPWHDQRCPILQHGEEMAAKFKRYRESLDNDPSHGRSTTVTKQDAINKWHNTCKYYHGKSARYTGVKKKKKKKHYFVIPPLLSCMLICYSLYVMYMT